MEQYRSDVIKTSSYSSYSTAAAVCAAPSAAHSSHLRLLRRGGAGGGVPHVADAHRACGSEHECIGKRG